MKHNPKPKIELSDEQIDQIETLAGYGLKVEQICRVLKISKSTLERRRSESKKLDEAVERGRSTAAASVTQTAFKMATSGKSAAMTIFWLKTQQRWRDPNVIQHEGLSTITEKPVLIVDLSGKHVVEKE